jgi:hypothetical protein
VRYFYHPESDSAWVVENDNEYVGTDGLVEEIDWRIYYDIKLRQSREKEKQMTVRVGGIFVVDGAEVQILTEGGSAKEAYAALLHYAEELGGLPAPPEANGADKKQRNRRTKSEMDAARAAAVDSGNAAPPRQPAPDLPGPAQPAPMSAFAPQTQIVPNAGLPFPPPAAPPPQDPYVAGVQQRTDALPPGQTRPGDWAPPAGPPVGFTDDAPMRQDGKAVGFDGPPPPLPGAPPAPAPPPP